MKKLSIFAMLSLSACVTMPKAETIAENESGYTYIPIDPFSVEMEPADNCQGMDPLALLFGAEVLDGQGVFADKIVRYRPFLSSFPDNTVRVSTEQISANGSISYGPAQATSVNDFYKITVDYVNADTINLPVIIRKKYIKRPEYTAYGFSLGKNSSHTEISTDYASKTVAFSDPAPAGFKLAGYVVHRADAAERLNDINIDDSHYNIPVYIGIGLRVTANVTNLNGTANISGLGVIGAEADAGNLRGSLVVQTLGVNGKSISAALPIQSELNRTTAQNAIVAVGSVKALLHENDTIIAPRVVGLYLPVEGGAELVNAIISEISKYPPTWKRPCEFLSAE